MEVKNMAKMIEGLTPKQLKFCDSYLKTGNASQAALDAGYAKKTAAQRGHNLLKTQAIQDYLKKHLQKMQQKGIASAEEVLEFYTKVLRGQQVDTTITPAGKLIRSPASASDRLSAGKEILKRYPTDKNKVEIKKLEAETRIAVARAKSLEDGGMDVEDALSVVLNKISDADKLDHKDD